MFTAGDHPPVLEVSVLLLCCTWNKPAPALQYGTVMGGKKGTVGSAEMPWREEHWIMCLVKRTLDCQDHLCWYKEKDL